VVRGAWRPLGDVGEFPIVGGSSQLFNSGGGYRITDTQQIELHLGISLNRNTPGYIFGIGYSFRLDGLFRYPGRTE
jgi:hypothetical protein